ncbi:type VII secretion protein EccB [Nocardioides sambongensis]|uniref:type VII secretion protein EccB n=1 Tax=Nocardioides sambongensis TaxID=2589074 RepID=UPI00112E2B72|nr:type VII secretion protein EccB [Nocardioides sambongensis]
MATKKDLVEAYAFSRRRLVTAFVSGAPGGREVEPARPGRAVIGGVALAVLLMAGAAILGVFKDTDEVDFDQVGLVSDDRGTLYVILADDIPGFDEPPLRQVVNVTSAQLILGAETEMQEASTDEIADVPKGPPIGIVNAPSTVPPASDLHNTGWTACVGGGETGATPGVRARIGESTDVTSAEDAPFLVQAGRQRFLIAAATDVEGSPDRAYSYALPDGPDQIYTSLGLDESNAVRVSEKWLALFPSGGALDPTGLGIEGFGEPISADLRQAGYPSTARNGDYFLSNGQPVVFTRAGTASLSDFGLAVLRATPMPAAAKGSAYPKEQSVGAGVALDLLGPLNADARWPTEIPVGDQPTQYESICAVLDTEADAEPAVHLAVDPGEEADSSEVTDPVDAEVAPGLGAVVRSGDWPLSTGGSPYLIDDRGVAYPIRGELELENLGYGSVDDVVVPDVWIKLFEPGVELSRDAALCPPDTSETPTCS